MIGAQLVIVLVLVATMVMFLWGRWRHDMVAWGALLVCVVTGLVPSAQAFAGFGHPAVITVACVLVLGYGLQITGAVDVLAKRLLPTSAGPTVSILALISLAALLSSFMNNVGALALLMPIGLQLASKHKLPAGKVLMPLAFGSILGGMTTLIGTPPNLIVAGYRATAAGQSFGMFDFAPVGLAVSVVGILFVGLIGWRLVPSRKQSDNGSFESGAYLSEVRIVEGSKAENKRLREVEQLLDEAGAQIVGMVRHEVRIYAPSPRLVLRQGDILVVEVEPESLTSALASLGLKLEEDVPSDAVEQPSQDEQGKPVEPGAAKQRIEADGRAIQSAPVVDDKAKEKTREKEKEKVKSEEVVVQELVVSPNSALLNRSASDIELRTSHGINLLAISRQGRRKIKRLRSTTIRAGDVLLMQGAAEALSDFANQFSCLPLATRDIRVPKKGQAVSATLVMVFAVGLAALGLLPAAVAFAAGALAMVVLGLVPVRSIYSAIDWSVIVLLAAMLPVADAMASTGAADVIARMLLESVAQGSAVIGLAVILVATMLLTDFMNNAATAAVMCPIAISTSSQLGVSGDAFLMAVAVGASCAFLTPIGHQNNTLILGPGGFRFGDYWRMGLPTDILVVLVGVPTLLWVWPL
ncbi:MAG: SLC13 family permease [Gammaproteobacteria bacterium]|nr:SLC13 family permease [Gammaproteobacteria bacterium]MBU0786512.1 SLC13 family permease [Gammaproteobacteria bacterium]MBU0817120.1 SLC13 family permease [Gammaproteobacteria bacterium]MBU1787759.1 SLC13 family permease [Gammaproteobacteria bacterium]